MATNLKDGKTPKSSYGSHGGNRSGDKSKSGETDKRSETQNKCSQAAGKDPHRGKD